MKQLHSGLDYKLYQVYVWAGLPAIVIYIVVSILVFGALNSPQPFLVIAGPMLLWFAGILLYWWWVFAFKGLRDLEKEIEAQSPGLPGVPALKSWNTLHQAMAISGGNVEALLENEKKARLPIILWFGGVNLLVVWILCPIALRLTASSKMRTWEP